MHAGDTRHREQALQSSLFVVAFGLGLHQDARALRRVRNAVQQMNRLMRW